MTDFECSSVQIPLQFQGSQNSIYQYASVSLRFFILGPARTHSSGKYCYCVAAYLLFYLAYIFQNFTENGIHCDGVPSIAMGGAAIYAILDKMLIEYGWGGADILLENALFKKYYSQYLQQVPLLLL
jgi:hypothetical protein